MPPPPLQPIVSQDERGRLHLAVAIVMPMSHTHRRKGSGKAQLPIYELGFLDIPWEGEKLALLHSVAPQPSQPEIEPLNNL